MKGSMLVMACAQAVIVFRIRDRAEYSLFSPELKQAIPAY
jgi:hypothetical protein